MTCQDLLGGTPTTNFQGVKRWSSVVLSRALRASACALSRAASNSVRERHSSGLKLLAAGDFQVEFILIDHQCDPCGHGRNQGSEISESHRLRVRLPVVLSFRYALQSQASACYFPIQVTRKNSVIFIMDS